MSEGASIQIKGRPLQCKHCGRAEFAHRRAQLNTAFLELLDLSWLNKSADVYACRYCGLLHWFLDPEVEQQIPAQEPATADDLAEATECLECHQTIPAGTARCPACGWTYELPDAEE